MGLRKLLALCKNKEKIRNGSLFALVPCLTYRNKKRGYLLGYSKINEESQERG
jgi:hypothetical protein